MDLAHCYLDGNADAVEFCPHDGFHHILAAATYTLQEGENPYRSGSISLFSADADAEDCLKLVHRMHTSGIFDIKWSPIGINTGPLLAQADADGYLRLHSLQHCFNEEETRGAILAEVSEEKISSSSMCLCLDWNPSATLISLGLSDGSLSMVSVREAEIEIQHTWEAHDFEVWATSFDTHQPQLVYSGADDCKFKCWDTRESPSNLVFQNSKTHKAGVCCIAKSPEDPNTLLTGSYDKYLRVWDTRLMSRPLDRSSIGLEGGVWRIKYHPFVPGLVLASCMHKGFAVVKTQGDEPEKMETYDKHNSLAYGGDWQKGESLNDGQRKRSLVATCSFYDRLLRLWMPEFQVMA
ncbi:hypothetical protein Scep_017849 [Stephania cephalantha]|uniref:methylated diphthine methylhydrolase n=1 Tax=Stephania cephalantha TaxID=152367 RepID=A0AAP0NXB4_9MAGN